MNLAIQRIKVYSKLILIILFSLFILLMVWKNWANKVTVWCFGEFVDINVLWLMFCTALFAVLTWITLRFAFGVVRDMGALKAHEDLQTEKKNQAELLKRIDQQTSDEKRSDEENKTAGEDG
ncbi:MAG: hypothetical protein GXP29_11420 [Planctomycetes bacterium]|nr:hypothetical protein [Planctomycetota bacterium]